MQPRQYSMVWMAWWTMVSPKSNCHGRKPERRYKAGRGMCRALSAGTNGYMGLEPPVLNSWWGFQPCRPQKSCLAEPPTGTPHAPQYITF